MFYIQYYLISHNKSGFLNLYAKSSCFFNKAHFPIFQQVWQNCWPRKVQFKVAQERTVSTYWHSLV